MTRALIAVGALLALAFAGLGLVVYLNRDEDLVAVDNVLALELTRAIGVADQERRARSTWRGLAPVRLGPRARGRRRARRARRSPRRSAAAYDGDLPLRPHRPALRLRPTGPRSCASPTTAGARTFTGFERPLDSLAARPRRARRARRGGDPLPEAR